VYYLFWKFRFNSRSGWGGFIGRVVREKRREKGGGGKELGNGMAEAEKIGELIVRKQVRIVEGGSDITASFEMSDWML
jgi:hypothetical protein